MQTVAARVANHRARRKAGLATFTCTADEFALKQMMQDANFLSPDDWDNTAAVQRAFSQLIEKVLDQ